MSSEFEEHMNLCGRCRGDSAQRCWQMEDILKRLATPNEIYATPIYPPEPQIDGDFPSLRLVTCLFCLEPVRLERRGGMNALGFFVTPYYVEGRPVHTCFLDVPKKEPVQKSAKRSKRAPVSWTRGLFVDG